MVVVVVVGDVTLDHHRDDHVRHADTSTAGAEEDQLLLCSETTTSGRPRK
jgi:hypothetical protein